MASWIKKFVKDRKSSTNGELSAKVVHSPMPPASSVDIPSGTDDSSENKVLQSLRAFKGSNINTLGDVALSELDGSPIDDKTYLMERIVQLTADLPLHDRVSDSLTNRLLSELWNDLDHPPKTALGLDYMFRTADGSNNNMMFPHIGKAGQPYARTVRPVRMQPTSRPDPGVLFDSLLARKTFRPHPNRISSVLFYLASIIIHDCFHTSHQDFAISESSSYLDLAPLYGSNEEQQRSVRTMKDGKLKPDAFADKRILGFPPGVAVFLIMFNRWHNHVVRNLAKIDEGGRFSNILQGRSGFKGTPRADGTVPTPAELYDEALFQTARLVTTGIYVNIILMEYVRTILNLNRADTLWNLDPRSNQGKAIFGKDIPEAQGNQCSAEFNLVYRWHSTVSERDAKWTEQAMMTIGQGKVLGGRDLAEALQKWSAMVPQDPGARTFENLTRNSDGHFSDADLARIWSDSVEDVGGAFGAAHVPPVLRSVEVLGIIQARAWNLATLNEFREYFKLQPHKTFESINPDPQIAKQLEKLYGHPDNVEIYPGIVVEAAKKPMKPGSGLCTNFTISRAVLSDAVALVRSDRFHTIDMTPQNLTNWGFNAANNDLNINHGCVIYKLILNAFPGHYSRNSIYAHYPMVVPDENRMILKDLGRDHLYNFDRPGTKASAINKPSVAIGAAALGDKECFDSLWKTRASRFGSTAGPLKAHLSFADAIMKTDEWEAKTRAYYSDILKRLWHEKAYELGGAQQIDVVDDVLNPAHISYVTKVLGIPLMEKEKSHSGHYGLFCLLGEIFEHAFGNPKPSNLRATDRSATHSLANAIKAHFKEAPKQAEIGKRAFTLLTEAGEDAEASAWQDVIPTAALITNTVSRLSAQTVEFYLDDKQSKTNASGVGGLDTGVLAKYAREATRLISNITLAKKASTQVQVGDKPSQSTVERGQVVVVDIAKTQNEVLKNADAFKLDRDDSVYSMKDYGSAVELAYKITYICNTAMLGILAGLSDVKRAPGPQGRIKKIQDDLGNVMYLNAEESDYVPYPTALKLRWTEQRPTVNGV